MNEGKTYKFEISVRVSDNALEALENILGLFLNILGYFGFDSVAGVVFEQKEEELNKG